MGPYSIATVIVDLCIIYVTSYSGVIKPEPTRAQARASILKCF